MNEKAREMRDLTLAQGILQSCLDQLDVVADILGDRYLPEDLIVQVKETKQHAYKARQIAIGHFSWLEKQKEQEAHGHSDV